MPSTSTRWRLYFTGVSGGSAVSTSNITMRESVSGSDACWHKRAGEDASNNQGDANRTFWPYNTNYWNSLADVPQWIECEFTEAITVVEYTIQTQEHDTAYLPTDWELQFYDGADWITYDTRENQVIVKGTTYTYESAGIPLTMELGQNYNLVAPEVIEDTLNQNYNLVAPDIITQELDQRYVLDAPAALLESTLGQLYALFSKQYESLTLGQLYTFDAPTIIESSLNQNYAFIAPTEYGFVLNQLHELKAPSGYQESTIGQLWLFDAVTGLQLSSLFQKWGITGTPIDALDLVDIYYVLEADGETLKMSSFQGRNRTEGQDYLSMVIPSGGDALDTVEALVSGTSQLVIKLGGFTRRNHTEIEPVPFITVTYETTQSNLGSRSSSLILTGHKNAALGTQKGVVLAAVSYIAVDTSGNRRVRCRLDSTIAVGDQVTLPDESLMIVGSISYTVGSRLQQMEVSEATV